MLSSRVVQGCEDEPNFVVARRVTTVPILLARMKVLVAPLTNHHSSMHQRIWNQRMVTSVSGCTCVNRHWRIGVRFTTPMQLIGLVLEEFIALPRLRQSPRSCFCRCVATTTTFGSSIAVRCFINSTLTWPPNPRTLCTENRFVWYQPTCSHLWAHNSCENNSPSFFSRHRSSTWGRGSLRLVPVARARKQWSCRWLPVSLTLCCSWTIWHKFSAGGERQSGGVKLPFPLVLRWCDREISAPLILFKFGTKNYCYCSPSLLEGKYSEHGLSHGGERWALAEFVCGTESWRHRDGEGLVRSMVAGSAELSRSLFVARSRDVSGWRGTGAEHGGGEGWALAEFVCGTESWRHRDGERLVRSMVAGRAELSRSLFVARIHDVIGMRHWRDFCVNTQKGREKASLFLRSTFRQMSKEREQEVFEEKHVGKRIPWVRRGTGECFEGLARRASYEGNAKA